MISRRHGGRRFFGHCQPRQRQPCDQRCRYLPHVPIGTAFTILENLTSNAAINSTFLNLPDGKTFTASDGQLSASATTVWLTRMASQTTFVITRSLPCHLLREPRLHLPPGDGRWRSLHAGQSDRPWSAPAFTTIAAALNTGHRGGRHHPHQPGSYAETVNDTKTVALDFVQDGTSILGLDRRPAERDDFRGRQLDNAMMLTIGDNTSPAAYAGNITGNGGIIKVGSGTLTFSGSAVYTGATTVSSGIVAAGAANAFSSGSAYAIAAGAKLQLNGFANQIGNFTSAPPARWHHRKRRRHECPLLSVSGGGGPVAWTESCKTAAAAASASSSKGPAR